MHKINKKNEVARSEPPLLILHWDTFIKILKTIGCRRAESGGAIGGYEDSAVVTQYHFDRSSRNSAVTYSPDYKLLNRLFKYDWNTKGIRLRGFVHSHPGVMGRPSFGDQVYAERILKYIEDLGQLWLPIVNTVPDTSTFQLHPWVVRRVKKGTEVVRGQLKIVGAPAFSNVEVCGQNVLKCINIGKPVNSITIGSKSYEDRSCNGPAVHSGERALKSYAPINKEKTMGSERHGKASWVTESTRSFNVAHTFDRVESAYDLKKMRVSRLISVGAGGAADWLENMARAGVGQFVMIDPDTVSETNLATQQTYRKDIGRPKVDCIAERIRDINPTARAIAIQKSLDDLSDHEIRRLAMDPIDGCVAERTLICGLTDNFFAQARINRIALQFGLPSLCAQVYREGRGAEITFTYPGITPACHRCILSSRYRYYLEEKHNNDVTSHGTPIFATTRLNSLKGFVAMAILHYGSQHPRWGGILERIGNRNLIQIRMDPDFSESIGIKVFDHVLERADTQRLFFDEVVWLPQEQECPETGYPVCPDCCGTGDLHESKGKFKDTRLDNREKSDKRMMNTHAQETKKSA